MAEKIYISELREEYGGKVVIQQFFTTKDAAVVCCCDLQHLEKYGYKVFIGEEKI